MGMGNNGDYMSELNFVHGLCGPGVVSSMALYLNRENRPVMGAVGNPAAVPGTNHAAQGLHTAVGSNALAASGIDGSLMNLNPQGVPNMLIPGANAIYPPHTGQPASLTPMGLNIMSNAQLNGLSPEKRAQAIDALQRRYDKEQFYGDGVQLRTGMSMAQGVPLNNAIGPNSVLNVAPNGNPSNPAINRIIGETPATSGSQIYSSLLNTRNMINIAAAFGFYTARENGMEPNAVDMIGLKANKLPGGAVGVGGFANRVGMNVMGGKDQALSTNTVGHQAGYVPTPIGAVPPTTPPATSERRLWMGTICLWGKAATHKVHCVAISGTMKGQPPI
ncbi:hypothetical protein FGB62_47g174 [Gracilaria domingensis]|nr:hypothetical protein FGB62_47g174 [Gracilaria domingensis]